MMNKAYNVFPMKKVVLINQTAHVSSINIFAKRDHQ